MINKDVTRNELLTVVVPIYNSAQYLKRCIESIIHQQYKNLDIILINDGSTDESGLICDNFKNLDQRIRVIHKNNQGLVNTRKLGLELAKGDLITFVDSDDWIDIDMYAQMMGAYMKFQPDLITSGITIENGDIISYEIDKLSEGLYEHHEIEKRVIPCMMFDEQTGIRSITPSVWNKIYKVKLLKDIMDLDETITYGEDAAITYIYITRASKLLVLHNCWYHYITHSDSMVRSYNINSFERIYRFYSYMKCKFIEFGLWNIMEKQVSEYSKIFLHQANKDLFNIEYNPIYLFPFELIEKGSRVIIYGAGKVGASYKKSLLSSEYATLLGWVDNNYKKLAKENNIIESPEILQKKEIDYIVVAIEDKEIASNIHDYLIKSGIAKNKIVWKSPHRLN